MPRLDSSHSSICQTSCRLVISGFDIDGLNISEERRTDLRDDDIDILRTLGKQQGLLGDIFAGAQSRFNNPVNLKKLPHVVAITCVAIPRLGPDPEIFLFHGGFDAPETLADPMRVAGFLAFLYPVSEAANVRERLGSVDYVLKR